MLRGSEAAGSIVSRNQPVKVEGSHQQLDLCVDQWLGDGGRAGALLLRMASLSRYDSGRDRRRIDFILGIFSTQCET